MNDIKRYSHTGNYTGDIQSDNDGEFVKFDDYEKLQRELRMIRKERDVCAKRIAELETNIHNIMYENMTLNVKVVGFERKTQEILDAINEGDA